MKTIAIKYIDTTPVTCKIMYDQGSENPREWDTFTKLALFHNRYNFGNDSGLSPDDYDGWDEFKAALVKECDAAVILPVQMYEHSGISIYIGDSHDRWDGGQLGFIYATRKDILEEYGGKRITPAIREKVLAVMHGEIEEFSAYVNGDVYGYTLTDARGEEVDSCWGFYGDEGLDLIKGEMKSYENIKYVMPWEV